MSHLYGGCLSHIERALLCDLFRTYGGAYQYLLLFVCSLFCVPFVFVVSFILNLINICLLFVPHLIPGGTPALDQPRQRRVDEQTPTTSPGASLVGALRAPATATARLAPATRPHPTYRTGNSRTASRRRRNRRRDAAAFGDLPRCFCVAFLRRRAGGPPHRGRLPPARLLVSNDGPPRPRLRVLLRRTKHGHAACMASGVH